MRRFCAQAQKQVDKCEIYLAISSLYSVSNLSLEDLFVPIQLTFVLSEFILRPENYPKTSRVLRELVKEVWDPSNITGVSSANCVIWYCKFAIVIPVIFRLFFIIIESISAHIRNSYEAMTTFNKPSRSNVDARWCCVELGLPMTDMSYPNSHTVTTISCLRPKTIGTRK